MAANKAQHIAPMRPPCQDGVIISDGMLYWGPWMCGCQLSLYGHIGLSPAGSFDFPAATDASRLDVGPRRHRVRGSRWTVRRAGRCQPQRSTGTSAVDGGDAQRRSNRAGRSSFLRRDGRPPRSQPAAWSSWATKRRGLGPGRRQRQGPLAGPHRRRRLLRTGRLPSGRLFVGSADGRVYAFEAATGRRLWRFHAAPANRWIPVYGKLMSTWPVAGGVVVDQGVVYAAAGIAHYDGTYVYALDAATGKVKWYNDSSGAISPAVDSGVSLQGKLYLRDGELRFLGGGVYETARYDLQHRQVPEPAARRPHIAVPHGLLSVLSRVRQVRFAGSRLRRRPIAGLRASYEGSVHSQLALFDRLPRACRGRSRRRRVGTVPRRRGQGPKADLARPESSGPSAAFVVGSEAAGGRRSRAARSGRRQVPNRHSHRRWCRASGVNHCRPRS